MRIIRLAVLFAFTLVVDAGQFPLDTGLYNQASIYASSSGRFFKPPLPNTVPTPGKLRYVKNSGVCETTPGVFQASGYADLTATESMWFWFFAARHNASTAPVSVWLNGGPGSSSMIGLFQENGPCRINADKSSVSYNKFSWNNVSNMLYIDQPIGAGYSHGDLRVNTTKLAVADLWQMLQIFFHDPAFANYSANNFSIWAESYGGHYAPSLASYILQQNAAIKSGKLKATYLNLTVLGIGNGLTDPRAQYPEYATYAKSNVYRPTVADSVIAQANNALYEANGCLQQIESCYSTQSPSTCSSAQNFCNNNILDPLRGPYDWYDVRQPFPDPYPPDLTTFLNSPSFMSKIGAESSWQETNPAIENNFLTTGDWMLNSGPDLEFVINSGVRTLIYAGDADYIVNHMGVEAMVDNLKTIYSSQYATEQFQTWTANDHPAGMWKRAGGINFTYIRVYGAGHEVPAYNYTNLAVGEAAYNFFNHTTNGCAVINARILPVLFSLSISVVNLMFM